MHGGSWALLAYKGQLASRIACSRGLLGVAGLACTLKLTWQHARWGGNERIMHGMHPTQHMLSMLHAACMVAGRYACKG
jgi:hypothetical protein